MKSLIAIPVYNGEKYISRTLESCLNQNLMCQILVVDNCSTDDTSTIVKGFAKNKNNILYHRNETNLGRVGNWNKCLQLFKSSDSSYIRFVFAGDEVLPDATQAVEAIFERFPDISTVAHPYEFITLAGHKIISGHPQLYDKLLTREEIFEYNFTRGGVLGAIICNVYSKKAIGDIVFDEKMMGKTEFDLNVMFDSETYYSGQTLSRFNLENHRTFGPSLSPLIGLEASYAEMRVLLANAKKMDKKKFESYQQEIMRNSFKYNHLYMDNKTLAWYFFASLRALSKRLVKKVMRS
jgi:glycosyltransferase involved in cell wall biosynthesis